MGKLRDFMTISMARIQLGTLPHATLGLFLAAGSLSELVDLSVLAYILLYFILITFACNINCLYDYEVDKKYKTHYKEAVDGLGHRTVRRILLAEVAIALFLICYLFSQRYYLTASLASLGLFFSYAYSANPLRIKKRGILSPFPVMIGLYTLPLLGGWFLLSKSIDLCFILFVLGYALMNEGFTLVNTCEDCEEDRIEGIRTWAHVFGLRMTLRIAHLFSLGGVLSLFVLVFLLFTSSGPLDARVFLSLPLIIALVGGLAVSIAQVKRSGFGENLQVSSKQYARKMPIWFASTRYPMLLIALFILL